MRSPVRADIQKHLRFNFITHTMEASFFGLALGFASYVTVIPLFVASLTDSSVLIGVIAAMRTIGLQLPQIFTANRVAGLRRYKPMVLFMTVQERLPFFGMALVALLSPRMETGTTLALMFLFVIWQAMGGGLTGTAWQSMVAKIIPPRLRGTFYGVLMSASNLMSSGGAIVAGLILSAGSAPANFGLCFFLAGISLIISFGFLSQIREPEAAPASETTRSSREFWRGLREILRRDGNFRLFIGARLLAQVASVGTAFFTVYAVRHFALDAGTAGVMTGVLLLAQVLTNPVFGWLGDRYSHRVMFAVGALLAGGS
ncbi:MAG: MFS transporter, partial [Anaerolineae bacterium]